MFLFMKNSIQLINIKSLRSHILSTQHEAPICSLRLSCHGNVFEAGARFEWGLSLWTLRTCDTQQETPVVLGPGTLDLGNIPGFRRWVLTLRDNCN